MKLRNTHLLSVVIFLTLGPMAWLSSEGHAQQVWFAPPDNLARGSKVINQDFPHLFDNSPGWSAHPDVFLLSPLFIEAAPEDSLRRAAAFLKQHHIALAVAIGSVQMDNAQRTGGECGFGLEGMTRPNKNHIIFSRLKRLGLDIQYVAMDEPLTFAHYSSAVNACRYSLAEVARRVAATVSEIRAIYPEVSFVEEEAPSAASPAQWTGDLGNWLNVLQTATGTSLYAVAFDVDWRQPWLQWVRPSIGILHSHNVRTGIFLDGTGPGKSDADWIAASKSNIQSVDAAKLQLDMVIIANWTIHPSRNLPEGDPETLTSLLKWYADRHPGDKQPKGPVQ